MCLGLLDLTNKRQFLFLFLINMCTYTKKKNGNNLKLRHKVSSRSALRPDNGVRVPLPLLDLLVARLLQQARPERRQARADLAGRRLAAPLAAGHGHLSHHRPVRLPVHVPLVDLPRVRPPLGLHVPVAAVAAQRLPRPGGQPAGRLRAGRRHVHRRLREPAGPAPPAHHGRVLRGDVPRELPAGRRLAGGRVARQASAVAPRPPANSTK